MDKVKTAKELRHGYTSQDPIRVMHDLCLQKPASRRKLNMQANLVAQHASKMQGQRCTLVILRVCSYMCLCPIDASVRT